MATLDLLTEHEGYATGAVVADAAPQLQGHEPGSHIARPLTSKSPKPTFPRFPSASAIVCRFGCRDKMFRTRRDAVGNKQPGGALSDEKADGRVATLVSLSRIRQIASATTGMLRSKWPRSQCAGPGRGAAIER
jgi:hypothetical protein